MGIQWQSTENLRGKSSQEKKGLETRGREKKNIKNKHRPTDTDRHKTDKERDINKRPSVKR